MEYKEAVEESKRIHGRVRYHWVAQTLQDEICKLKDRIMTLEELCQIQRY